MRSGSAPRGDRPTPAISAELKKMDIMVGGGLVDSKNQVVLTQRQSTHAEGQECVRCDGMGKWKEKDGLRECGRCKGTGKIEATNGHHPEHLQSNDQS